MAYNDTVIDALTIQASKLGIDNGIENLNSISFIMQAVGAISGGLMAELISMENILGPFKCFSIYMFIQMLFFMAALLMNDKLEPGNIKEIQYLEDSSVE